MSRDSRNPRKPSGRLTKAKAAEPVTVVRDLARRFASVVLITFVAAYLYALAEWLFFFTKPSFLSASTTSSALVILALSPLGIFIPSVTGVLVLCAVAFAVSWMSRSHPAVSSVSASAGIHVSLAVFPSLIVATLSLLLIDNFSYTIWQFGIVSTEGATVWGYTALFSVLAVSTFLWLVKMEQMLSSLGRSASKVLFASAAATTIVSLFCLGFVDRQTIGWSRYWSEAGIDPATVSRPNILIYTSDGLSATHLSAYGYPKKTTPFLDDFIRRKPVLLFENAYANAANTGGSLTSLLTGKYPFTVRVLQAPHILRGNDSLQHFPGILENLGYRSHYTGMRYFADPFDFNMRNAFDTANDRATPSSEVQQAIASVVGQATALFCRTLFNRASERILHLSHIQPIEDVFAAVTKGLPKAGRYTDLSQRVIDFIDESDEPFFAFVHNMGTHGPEFFNFPPKQQFSKWDNRKATTWISMTTPSAGMITACNRWWSTWRQPASSRIRLS